MFEKRIANENMYTEKKRMEAKVIFFSSWFLSFYDFLLLSFVSIKVVARRGP